MLHEVHRVPYGLGGLFVSGIYCQIQRLLDGLRQPGGRLLWITEDLRPVDGGVLGHTVLMDAEQHRMGQGVDQRHTVLQVRHLLLPQGLGLRRIDGLLPCSGQSDTAAQKHQQPLRLSDDLQVDAALRHAIRGHGAAVLPAVSGIQHDDRPR